MPINQIYILFPKIGDYPFYQVFSKFGLTDKSEVLIGFQLEFVVQKKIQWEK